MVTSILVTGASGNLGKLIVEHLTTLPGFNKTFKVVAGSRTPEKLDALVAKGVEARKLDLEDVSGTEQALIGVDRLLLVSTDAFGKRFAAHKVAIDAAVKQGVKHIVYTSFGGASPDRPLYEEHFNTEAYLAAGTKIGFTLLRNGLYQEILLGALTSSLPHGEWKTATGKNKRSYTSRNDLALASAIVVSSVADENARVSHELTDDHVYSANEVVALVTEVTGLPLKHVEFTDDQLIAFYASFLPHHVAVALSHLDTHTRLGMDHVTTGELAKILGRAPLSLKDFLVAHKAALTATKK